MNTLHFVGLQMQFHQRNLEEIRRCEGMWHLHNVVEVGDEEDGAEAFARKALGQAQQHFHGRKAQPVYVVVHLPILHSIFTPLLPTALLPGRLRPITNHGR